jgi:hypothetical protein
MLTQERLIRRLNQLTLRYNLTWFDIEFDADKAIAKINNFLGTKYPKLSTVLTSPESTYTITKFYQYAYVVSSVQYKADTVAELQLLVTAAGGPNPMIEDSIIELKNEYEIIKEEYFHSIIIPYIAAEILARDEEFTTIYNKYVLEMQEGLYDMFQKEFNSVPFDFRQNPDQGVFFGLDTAQGITQHNERNLNIPTFKFTVNYYANNNDVLIEPSNAVPQDLNGYAYLEEATVRYIPTTPYFSTGFDKQYTFLGWARERISSASTYIPPAVVKIPMISDVNLYARWNSVATLLVEILTGTFRVTINALLRSSFLNLIIPENIDGLAPVTIPSNFVNNSGGTLPSEANDKLTSVTLPSTIRFIESNAFRWFRGTTINLNEGITRIETNAFVETLKLVEIIIPASVQTIQQNAFPVVSGKRLVIKCRTLEANKPQYNSTTGTGWHPNWYAVDNLGSNYTVEIIWGYNG